MSFQLDARLKEDCFTLAESEDCLVLLLNNRFFPWFVVVPKTTQIELYLMPEKQQLALKAQVNWISDFLNLNFPCDKLNVASIGNIVKQLHVHVIARTEDDPCWPGVVWGTSFKQQYKTNEVVDIQEKLQKYCTQHEINDLQFALLQ